jgi:hypothetical protein
MDQMDQEELLHGWQPTRRAPAKDVAESARVGRAIRAVPQACWFNARRAILWLDEYADASYVEGWAVLGDCHLPIEHGWLVRADAIIDPTLPEERAAYYPGLEFQGRQGIAEFLRTARGRRYRDRPFFYAFGWGGTGSPSFKAAQEAALAYFLERMQVGGVSPAS